MITLSSKITSRRRPRRTCGSSSEAGPQLAGGFAYAGVLLGALAVSGRPGFPAVPPMINKPAVIASIPVTDDAPLLAGVGSSGEDHGERGAAPPRTRHRESTLPIGCQCPWRGR